MKLIEVKDLSFSYDENIPVLSDISFALEEGTYTVIVGHNGSGKSTLAKLLAGLLAPNKGEIKIGGTLLNADTIESMRAHIGIVFQNPDNQFIGSTVRDDIAFGLENHLVPSAKMDEIINTYAAYVSMQDYLDKEPSSLSGGQKQRVAIAGVLAMQPSILLLDEATSMLDPKGRKEVGELIHALHQKKQLTILSITHDIEETRFADNVIVLNKGKIYRFAKAEKLFENPDDLKNIGLDIPYIYELRAKYAKYGIHLRSRDIEGMAEELWQLNLKK